MSQPTTESKPLLSHTIAEWACSLKYEHLSPEAIQAAKLFWFDSIGCALGGSQQEDAKILLKHYRAMAGEEASSRDSSTKKPALSKAEGLGMTKGKGDGKATVFVSGFKTNPVDAAFLNGHMMRAMDYNDIYWKADPCHPSDLIAAPLALCENEGLSGKDLILATIIAYEIEMRLCEIGRPGVREYGWHHATLSAFAAPVAAGRALNLTPEQMVSAIGISASRTFCPGAVTAGKLTNMKNTVDPWAGRMGAESALLAREGFSGPEHIIDGKEGLFAVFSYVQYKGEPASFDGEGLVKDLPTSPKSHYRILDCGMKSFPIEALSHSPLTAMMKTVKDNNIKADDVKEIKVEVIARAADILGDPHKYRPDSKETADHSLAVLHGGRARGRDGDAAAIPRRARARSIAHSNHGQGQSGRKSGVRSAVSKISAKSRDDHHERRQIIFNARRCSQGRSARSDDRRRNRGEIQRARQRRDRQGSMQRIAEVHHEFGDRGKA